VAGGAGAGVVSERLAARQITARCLHLGIPDRFLDQATQQEQLADCGLDAAGIEAAVRDALAGYEVPSQGAEVSPNTEAKPFWRVMVITLAFRVFQSKTAVPRRDSISRARPPRKATALGRRKPQWEKSKRISPK